MVRGWEFDKRTAREGTIEPSSADVHNVQENKPRRVAAALTAQGGMSWDPDGCVRDHNLSGSSTMSMKPEKGKPQIATQPPQKPGQKPQPTTTPAQQPFPRPGMTPPPGQTPKKK
jgi:hypothetical protein